MTTIPFDVTQAMVRDILRRPLDQHDWTVQGFGFIRTYFLGKRFRVNVWDSRLKSNASTIHDHPWDFRSWIIGGQFDNVRYALGLGEPTHSWMWLRTGVGGGPVDETRSAVRLEAKFPESYVAGDTYCQGAHEVHDSLYHDGAVTLNERFGDTERARVFWPYGEEWQDAMPRSATDGEVKRACAQALDVMEASI